VIPTITIGGAGAVDGLLEFEDTTDNVATTHLGGSDRSSSDALIKDEVRIAKDLDERLGISSAAPGVCSKNIPGNQRLSVSTSITTTQVGQGRSTGTWPGVAVLFCTVSHRRTEGRLPAALCLPVGDRR
jgi:hypothetical protein